MEIARPLFTVPSPRTVPCSRSRSPFVGASPPHTLSMRAYVIGRGLLCVNPANASALRTSRISFPCTLSLSNGSRVASAGAPFAGARGYVRKAHISHTPDLLSVLNAVKKKGHRTRTSAGISSSKCRVSSGLLSCGLNGASIRWILFQSIPLNHTCACGR